MRVYFYQTFIKYKYIKIYSKEIVKKWNKIQSNESGLRVSLGTTERQNIDVYFLQSSGANPPVISWER